METAFGKRLDRVRQASPLVHCISNLVTANDCANIVLAAGASPIMADAPEEVREITALSRALCLSLGTPNPRKADAMFLAGRKAAELGLPVVFDPVGVGASAYRQEIAQKLLRDVPLTVLRCNASELQTLSGQSLVSRGVDAGKAPELETLLPLAGRFAAAHHCIVAVTGAEDIVTDGTTAYGIRSGTPLLRQVTGTGCMLSVLAGKPRSAAGSRRCRRLHDGSVRGAGRRLPDRGRGHRHAAHPLDGRRFQHDRRRAGPRSKL